MEHRRTPGRSPRPRASGPHPPRTRAPAAARPGRAASRAERAGARSSRAAARPDRASSRAPGIPADADTFDLAVEGRTVHLTNLRKPFWPSLGINKGDLLRYYAEVAPWLLPHLRDRAMVMKRYPNGAGGPFFFMKRTPDPHPEWLELCSIEHGSGSVIAFPMVQDQASLLWLVNLGCIDLNPWYARCDDTDRPDWVHFDLDPVPGAGFDKVREAALVVRDALEGMRMPCFAKTTGSRGIHVYVPIVRGPTQKEVWGFAKALAVALAGSHPALLTSEYRVARRPRGRVLVDYNQNAWGRTLASIYSVRPAAGPYVSTPLGWDEIEGGARIEDFDVHTVPARLRVRGDLWAPLLEPKGRFALERYLAAPGGAAAAAAGPALAPARRARR